MAQRKSHSLAAARFHRMGAAGFLAAVCVLAWIAGATCAFARPDATDTQILIGRLGARTFEERERAMRALEARGVEALDELRAAESHPDFEVRQRIRTLLGGLRERLLLDDIDPLLRHALKQYLTASMPQRRQIIDQMAELLPVQGYDALTRIAQLDEQVALAELAALAILRKPLPNDAARREQVRKIIGDNLRPSNRPCVAWLAWFVRNQTPRAESIVEWERFVAAAQAPDDATKGPIDTNRLRAFDEIALDLHLQAGETERARRLLDKLSVGRETDPTWIDWLLQRKQYDHIIALHKKEPKKETIPLRARLQMAVAYRRAGDEANGQQLFSQAIQSDAAKLEVDALYEAYFAASMLEDDYGMLDWAEKLYDWSMGSNAENGIFREQIAIRLAELLHDQQRDREAGETLRRLLSGDENPPHPGLPQALEESPSYRARMHLFFADHHMRAGEIDKAREHLDQGIEIDPTEIDLLIARFRFQPRDKAFHARTVLGITQAASKYDREIDRWTRSLQVEDESARRAVEAELAQIYNEYAWLIANTEGDFQVAIERSRRSLELSPGTSAYLDTLGRCYFAAGKRDEAIAFQRMACERSPHELLIRRQLELFLQGKPE